MELVRNYLYGLKSGDELLLPSTYVNFLLPPSLDRDLLSSVAMPAWSKFAAC